MSENTVNAGLRRLGYGADEMTGHGFRAMASTLLNESGKWHPDAIERALAHGDSDEVRAAYHRGALEGTGGNGSMVVGLPRPASRRRGHRAPSRSAH
jgi:integrase